MSFVKFDFMYVLSQYNNR